MVSRRKKPLHTPRPHRLGCCPHPGIVSLIGLPTVDERCLSAGFVWSFQAINLDWTWLHGTGNKGNRLIRAGHVCQPIPALVHNSGYFDARKPFARGAPTDNALKRNQFSVTGKVQFEANIRRLAENNFRRNTETTPAEEYLLLPDSGGKTLELQLQGRSFRRAKRFCPEFLAPHETFANRSN